MRIHGIEHFPPSYRSANLGRSYVLYSTSRGRYVTAAQSAVRTAPAYQPTIDCHLYGVKIVGTQKYCTVGSLGFCCNFGSFWLFQLVFPVALEVSNVRTISGFSCATETGWNSGLADPNSSVTGFGADIFTSAGRETTSGCRATFGSGFRRNFGPSVYVI